MTAPDHDFAPAVRRLLQDDGRHPAPHWCHKCGKLGCFVRSELRRIGLQWVDVPPASLKKYATGKGNANKGEMLAAAIRRLDYQGSSDNEADALFLQAMGLDALGYPPVNMPESHRIALQKVTWPEYNGAEK